MVTYNDVDYFYVYNLQGDVVALIDANGTQVVEYVYDAWGNPISKTGSLAATIGTLNPFRYRGYVYDEETELYYLRNRYYKPAWRRFINSDGLISGTDDILNKAQFTYCSNNPVMMSDGEGNWPDWGKLFSGTSLLALGLTAVAAGLSVVTCGVAAPAMVYVATAVMAAGTVSAVNGASEMIESSTDFNLMRDVVYQGNQQLYEGQRNKAAIVAQAGTTAMSVYQFVHPVCFVEGTMVSAEFGDVPIEKIKIGDFVWTKNIRTGKCELKRVTRTFQNEIDEIVHVSIKNEEITCTREHPFYVLHKGWIAAKDLKPRDILMQKNGEKAWVISIQCKKVATPTKVFNFEVEDNHNYFVGEIGILVHNRCLLGKRLSRIEADPGKGYHAHHVFPQQMRSKFRACGIEVDKGIYGSWVEAKQHLGFSAKYNQEWNRFLKPGTPKEAVLAKGREMALKYKFTIHY